MIPINGMINKNNGLRSVIFFAFVYVPEQSRKFLANNITQNERSKT